MGLFDRLFGKQKEELEDSVSPEIGEQTEEVVDSLNELEAAENYGSLDEDFDMVVEEKEFNNIDRIVESEVSDDDIIFEKIQGAATDFGASSLAESAEPAISDEKDLDSNNLVNDASDSVQDSLNSDEVVSPETSSSEVKNETNAAASAFMADYYAKRAAIEKSIEDGTFVKPEVKQVEPVQEETIAESPAFETKEEKYNRSLKKTRTGFGARLNAFLANFRTVDEEFFEELEEMLILSDVGVNVASQLTEDLRYEAKLEKAKKADDLKRVIIEKLVDIYEKDGVYNERINMQDDLTVMLFVGVNGVGKTTSIGKLAYKYKQAGKKVMLVAADTFRAGAVAQLAEWGRRVDVPVVTGPEKADPASVVFDGMEKAVAEKVDILMIDTAGRLQNKENLMAELEKMGRIIKRVLPDAPHETLLALDASTGQNALSQAKEFSKITPLTGLILTKIDGTAKGGVVLAIRQELDIPVKFIGFGEKIDDIGEFNSEDFMRGLLEGII